MTAGARNSASSPRHVGVGYITRDNNRHAKAGNINHALQLTDGEFIAMFDCDHVPTRSFLQIDGRLVHAAIRSSAWCRRRTISISPDPFERNLARFGTSAQRRRTVLRADPGRQRSLERAFFCGSCAVLRRTALEDDRRLRGRDGDRRRAYRAADAPRRLEHGLSRLPQAAGLATERLAIHVGQRMRWARGMTQIFRVDNPLLGRGLSFGAAHLLPQRDAALLFRLAAVRVSDRAARLPDVPAQHHRGERSDGHRLCRCRICCTRR